MLLDYTVTGNPAGPVVVLVHGWPDGPFLWDDLTGYLSRDCWVVRVALPSFDPADRSPEVDLPEIADRLDRTILQVLSERPGEKIILVGHDWGAYFAYLLDERRRPYLDSLITLDVGGHIRPITPGHALFLVSYQWWLASAWLIGRKVPTLGNSMTRLFAALAKAPAPHRAHYRMDSLYFYFWRALLVPRYREGLLLDYRPRVPVLFLYGGDKRYPFHSAKWLAMLKEDPASAAVEMRESGHWLMRDQAAATNERIRDRILKVGRPTSPSPAQ